ncbi:carbonyl reductase [NADPH] 3-like [Paramacrobiotus metropolitanus]|uniref:carbonyl reductase [NADPH] 3-like n=1 Tax=Paramacrobiotus metropolitanus TaxID=2943436 RepID=UPI002445B9F2|nr:carbonyl reductase [NADPH] 3-like [Paramacrobiotus metropolitanus]XP_055353647.1 carbonyl reductase [NADPH] 3-like [Paramacrobiotus metropolitanus]XP_055353648.1 carbonyl reductase [NADPH] 3-like [Paramacrobiotus metropolitanus]
MSAGKRIALVTGANKGIGFAIVRGLCKALGDRGTVYLAARNEQLGQQSVAELKTEENLHSEFIQLDVTDRKSIEKARDAIVERHGGLDILVNNAGMAFKHDATESFGQQAEVTMATNFFGLSDVCDVMFPILRSHARVVNVSSCLGNVNTITSATIKARVISDDLTVDELKTIMSDFVSAAKRDTQKAYIKEVGFPTSAYGMSKIGVTALSSIQQRQLDQDRSRTDIVVNAIHPGYVDTDLTSHKGSRTIDEGAVSSIYAALLPEKTDIRGQYVSCNSQVEDWRKGVQRTA